MIEQKKESFVFYRGFREAINALPVKSRLKAIEYLMDYAFDGVEPEQSESSVERALFLAFKPQIDASQKRYEANVKNGKNGGRPKKENNTNKTENNPIIENENPKQAEYNLNYNDNVNDNDNDNVNDNENINDNENVNDNENDNTPKGEKRGECCKEIRNNFVFSEPLGEKVDEWLMYKKERRKPYQATGLKRLLSQIQKKCSEYGQQAVIDVIDMSIANNYEGILWEKIAENKGNLIYGNWETNEVVKENKYRYGEIL